MINLFVYFSASFSVGLEIDEIIKLTNKCQQPEMFQLTLIHDYNFALQFQTWLRKSSFQLM